MSGGRFFTLTKKPNSTNLLNSSWICCCISGDNFASFESFEEHLGQLLVDRHGDHYPSVALFVCGDRDMVPNGKILSHLLFDQLILGTHSFFWGADLTFQASSAPPIITTFRSQQVFKFLLKDLGSATCRGQAEELGCRLHWVL